MNIKRVSVHPGREFRPEFLQGGMTQDAGSRNLLTLSGVGDLLPFRVIHQRVTPEHDPVPVDSDPVHATDISHILDRPGLQ